MLVVKTIDQVINTYEVPDVLTGDFLRWLAQHSKNARDYLVDKQFMSETVVHAGREPDRPGASEGQSPETSASSGSDEGVRTK